MTTRNARDRVWWSGTDRRRARAKAAAADPLSWADGYDFHLIIDPPSNTARLDGVDFDDIADLTGWSALTSALSDGFLTGTASMAISLPYPFSLFLEYERVTDTGGVEDMLGVDSGGTTDRARMALSAADQPQAVQRTAGTNVANVIVGSAIPLATRSRFAARFGLNNVQACSNGTLGTADTAATAPATGKTLWIGRDRSGVVSGVKFRRIALAKYALTDAQMQALTAP